MDIIFKNKRYKEQIDQLSDETVTLIAKDHLKALEAAQKGIAQQEQEKVDDIEYLEAVATEMQKLAQKVLEERKK